MLANRGDGMRTLKTLVVVTALALAAGTLNGVSSGDGVLSSIEGRNAGSTAIVAKKIVGGLNQPVGFTFSPSGKIFYVEKPTGDVRIYNPSAHTNHLFLHLRGVNADGERGTLGVALDPGFPNRPYVYVYATRVHSGRLQNQIIRLTDTSGKGSHPKIIFSTPASVNPYHNGGRILFGPDGMLFAIVGEGHNSKNSQNLSNPRGKILRMKPSGRPPTSNPFPHSLIWSFGIRNSFGFTFDPKTAKLWETENGPECNDEINLIVKGANFGWGPKENCGGTSPGDTNNSGPKPRLQPELWFVKTIAITGDAFCDGCHLGSAAEGDLFFGDVANGTAPDGVIREVNLNSNRTGFSGSPVIVLSSPGGSVISMEVGPRGYIYFSDFGAIYKLTLG
jgi:glucose/arabinose dehydrogenase